MRFNGRNSPATRGSALIFTLITIAVLTAGVTALMQKSNGDTTISGDQNLHSRAYAIAREGLAIVAKQVLDEYEAKGNFNSLLGVNQTRPTGGGQYGVWILDNDNIGGVDQDGDGKANTDHDGIFRLVSTGQVGATKHVIDALYQVHLNSTPPPPPSSDLIGAIGLCSNNTDVSRAGNISGIDYNPPSYPCSGNMCDGTASGNPAKPGVSFNSETIADLSGTPVGNPGINSNAGIDCNAWTTFMNTASALATSTYSSSTSPFNAMSATSDFGTPSAPRIILIQGTSGEKVQFNGDLYGNGILIIRNAQVTFNGTFTFAGLILIDGEGGMITIGGTSQLFGSMMVMNSTTSDSQVEINISSNKAKVQWSAEARRRADDALAGAGGGGGGGSGTASLKVVSWRNFAG